MEKKIDQEAERLLAEKLTEGEQNRGNPDEEAVKQIPPRWEIRVQTERDPVAEETAQYRKLAKEVDDRYDGKTGGSGASE